MDTRPGILGTAITIGSGLLGVLAKHEAELRALSFAVSIAVGSITFAWWVRKWTRALLGKDKKDEN